VTAAHTYTVIPRIPTGSRISFASRRTIGWSWIQRPSICSGAGTATTSVGEMLRKSHPDAWARVPGAAGGIDPDDGFLAHMDRVAMRLSSYMRGGRGLRRRIPTPTLSVAYFCAEFGIVRGAARVFRRAGILAGDHLKSASDLGIPLTAVGLAYAGAISSVLECGRLAAGAVSGSRLYIFRSCWSAGRTAPRSPSSRLTRAQGPSADLACPVGECVVSAGHRPAEQWSRGSRRDRYLYGGDKDMRIRQEILLGSAGVPCAGRSGDEPTVCI